MVKVLAQFEVSDGEQVCAPPRRPNVAVLSKAELVVEEIEDHSKLHRSGPIFAIGTIIGFAYWDC